MKVVNGQRVKRWNVKFWVWVVWYMFWGKIFVKKAKMTLEHFFERPKSDKNWKSEKCRNPRKWRRKWSFWAFKTANLIRFQDSDLNFCTHIHRQVFLYTQGVHFQVKSLLVLCLIILILTITFPKWVIIRLPMKWHNIFTMSSVIPSAAFRVNDPVLAFLRRATSGRQALFGIGNRLFRIFVKKR